MKSNEHVEIRFLIKAFAWWSTEDEAITHFEHMYGKKPTRRQLTYSNLNRYIHDLRPHVRKNHRVKLFKIERQKAKAAMKAVPIADDDWRMYKLQQLFDKSEERAAHTGNTSRCTDILKDAAKEIGGAYAPKVSNINIDSRTQIMNMSDEEINKRFSALADQFKRLDINIPDIPLIERGAKAIDVEADPPDSEQQG